jgi:hypothetical protein
VKELPIIFTGESVRAILAGTKTQTRRTNGLDDVNRSPAFWVHDPAAPFPTGSQVGPLDYMAKPSARGKFGCTFFGFSAEPRELRVCPVVCPYGAPGDRLWVRETFRQAEPGIPSVHYRADIDEVSGGPWTPSIYTPRWASRLLLEVVEVRVQRVQEISEEDAIAEGAQPRAWGQWWQGYRDVDGRLIHSDVGPMDAPPDWMIEPHPVDLSHMDRTARQEFAVLWDQINGKRRVPTSRWQAIPGSATDVDTSHSWESNPWCWCITFRRVEPA